MLTQPSRRAHPIPRSTDDSSTVRNGRPTANHSTHQNLSIHQNHPKVQSLCQSGTVKVNKPFNRILLLCLVVCLCIIGNVVYFRPFNRSVNHTVSHQLTGSSVGAIDDVSIGDSRIDDLPLVDKPNRPIRKLVDQPTKPTSKTSLSVDPSHSQSSVTVVTSHANTAAAQSIQADPRFVNQPIKLSINQPDQSIDDVDLFISTIINQYNRLPEWIAVIDQSISQSEAQPMIDLLAQLLTDDSVNQSMKYINLRPGDYQCHAYIDPLSHPSSNQNVVVDELYREGKSINQNMTNLYHKIVFNQPISEPVSFALATSCADSAQSFVVHRSLIKRYQLADYQSVLRTCRKQLISQSISQSNKQCDFAKLVPHLYSDQSINHPLWLPPLLSKASTYQFYQTQNFITQSINESLRIEDFPTDQSSKHPLYKQITDPLYRKCRIQLIVIPSVDDRIRLATDQSKDQSIDQSVSQSMDQSNTRLSVEDSERMYDWLMHLPMSLDPQTIQLTILHHEAMKQSIDQTTDLESIIQSIDDPYTLDLIYQNYTSKNRIRPDKPSIVQSIKSVDWLEPATNTFLRYLTTQWLIPNSIKCISIYQPTYERYRENGELHRDRLQSIMKIKYQQTIKESINQGFVSLNVDGYTCEHDIDPSINPSANVSINQTIQRRSQAVTRLLRARFLSILTSVNGVPSESISQLFEETIKRALAGDLNQSIDPSINQYVPPTFCYYRGEFAFTRRALEMIGFKKFDALFHAIQQLMKYPLINQSVNQSLEPLSRVDFYRLIDESMEPLWSWMFHRHSQFISPRFIAYQSVYQSINQLYLSFDESLSQSAHTCTPDQYRALTSPWDDSEIESTSETIDWTVVQDQSINQSNNQSTDQSVIESYFPPGLSLAIISAAFDEDLTWLQSISPSVKKVVIRQDHPRVLNSTLFYGLDQSIKQSINQSDSTLSNTLHLTSKGLCKEGSSYLKFIIQYYHTLPDYMIFLHGQSISWHYQEPIRNVIHTIDWKYVFEQSINQSINLSERPFYYNLNTGFYSFVRPDHWYMIANHYYDLVGKSINESNHVWNGTVHLPELIGFHAAAQFLVNRASIQRHSIDWWIRRYQFCRQTHLTPMIASRLMEYMWHGILGQPAIEKRQTCGIISKQQKCTLQSQPKDEEGKDELLNGEREI